MKLSKDNIRKSAKGQDCTVQIGKVCNENPETTVYAHATILPPTGIIGGKQNDVVGGYYACSSCHDEMDGRSNRLELNRWDKLWYEYRAVVRTWRIILGE